jgi:hypothetical protein
MKICSYFNNLYLDAFKEHCAEIIDHGFDTILFCVPEAIMKWNLGNIRAMKEFAERSGLITMADPWGIGGLFAGEAINSINYKRDGLETALHLYEKWLLAVGAIGFKSIFIDEPKEINSRFFDNKHFDFYVCLADDKFDFYTDTIIKTLPFKSVGLSAYFWTDDKEKIALRCNIWFERLTRLRPYDCHVWIQGFHLDDGREWIPQFVYEQARKYNISDFGFWGFRSCEAISSIRPKNYINTWNNIKF